jgi:hypothetical protein
MFIFVTLCVLFYCVCIVVLRLLAKSQYPEVPAQVFLGFPVFKSECCDDSQDSKLLLHAFHVALPT